jgi:hypothetical protein
MIEKLQQIYKNKIIVNIKEFDYNKYYYFYTNNTLNEVFGIEKTISDNEYHLIKSTHIEKKIYDNNGSLQNIYEYLFENNTYPFKNKKAKLLIIDSTYKDFKELLLSFYKEVEVIQIDNIYVAFCIDSYNQAISDFITTLSDDLGISLKIHEGITLTSNFSGNVVLHYIGIIKEFFAVNDDLYSDSATVMLTTSLNSLKEYISIIDKHIIAPIFKDSMIKDIILTYFKNDLNVSKTAKDLYINRNSLLNKFEIIYKETGFNLQKFNHACAIYLFVLSKGNNK